MVTLRQCWSGLKHLLFPGCCALCLDEHLEAGPLCLTCCGQLDLQRAEPFCPRCAAMSGPGLSPDGRCGNCRDRVYHFEGSCRVAGYDRGWQSLIRLYKFHGAEYLDQYCAELLARRVMQESWWPAVDALVPVPPHWQRRLMLKPYLAEALARDVGRRVGRPVWPLLQRIRWQRSQIGLNLQQRLENVRGAFMLRRGARVAGGTVAVVDDVMTSGATLQEVARVLKAAGASQVYNLILARAGQQQIQWQLA